MKFTDINSLQNFSEQNMPGGMTTDESPARKKTANEFNCGQHHQVIHVLKIPAYHQFPGCFFGSYVISLI
jgi:hypothetical protein